MNLFPADGPNSAVAPATWVGWDAADCTISSYNPVVRLQHPVCRTNCFQKRQGRRDFQNVSQVPCRRHAHNRRQLVERPRARGSRSQMRYRGFHPAPPASARHPQAPIPTAPHVRLRSCIFEKTSFDIICCEAWQKPRGWRRVWWRRVNASCAVERCASPDSARLRARSLGRLARDIHSLTFPRRAHPAGGQVYSCDERGQMPSGEYVHTACLRYQKMNSGAPPPPALEPSQCMKLRSVDGPTSWKVPASVPPCCLWGPARALPPSLEEGC